MLKPSAAIGRVSHWSETCLGCSSWELTGWAPGQPAAFSDKGTEPGLEQTTPHRWVLMRAGGDLARYLVKTNHHKSDTFGPRELEETPQMSHNQKGPRADVFVSRIWFSFHYTSH